MSCYPFNFQFTFFAGCGILGGANAYEIVLSENKKKKIKEIIDDDIKLTEPLRNWVEISQNVALQFSKMLKCNVASPDFVTVMEACENCMKLLNGGVYEIKNLIRDLPDGRVQGIGNLPRDVANKLIFFFTTIQKNPKYLETCRDICERITIPNMFVLVSRGAMIYAQICIPSCNPYFLPSCNKPVLKTIEILFNLLTAVSLSEVKEWKSKYCQELDSVVWALQLELDQVNEKMNGPIGTGTGMTAAMPTFNQIMF